jgi:hypothetical protein
MDDGKWEIRVFQNGQLVGVPVYCTNEGLATYMSLLMGNIPITMEEAG